MDLLPKIEMRPNVMLGKPCLKGTRIAMSLLLEKLGAGETSEQILAAYTHLTKDRITAALQCAAALASNEIVLAW